MKRVIPAVVLALLVPMGLSTPPASAVPVADDASVWTATPAEWVTPREGVPSTDDSIWYVDDTGNDTYNCLSPTTADDSVGPCKSISKAIEKATADDTISVAAGTYSENINVDKRLTITGAGSGVEDDTNTIITAAAAGNPTISYSAGGDNLTDRQVLRNVRVTGAGSGTGNLNSGIYISGGSMGYFTFDNVTATNNTGSGLAINLAPNTATLTDVYIKDSEFSSNGDFGVRTASHSVDGLTVKGSRFKSNADGGFVFNSSGTNDAAITIKNISLEDVTFSGNNGASAADLWAHRMSGPMSLIDVDFLGSAGNGKSALSVSGLETNVEANREPIGTVTLNGVTVSGSYTTRGIRFANYKDVAAVIMTDVKLNTVITDLDKGTGHLELGSIGGTLDVGNTAFNTATSQKDIVVNKTTGGPASTVVVDATKATFSGKTGAHKTGAQMTLDERFAEADRIRDGVDGATDGTGVVTYVADNVFITPNSFVSPATAANVQNAVTAASANDTVRVQAGTYGGNVSIEKPLSLLGPNAAISPNAPDNPELANPARSSEAVVEGTITLSSGATGSEISGLKLVGAGRGVGISGTTPPIPPNNVKISRNFFVKDGEAVWWADNQGRGVNSGGKNWTLSDNRAEATAVSKGPDVTAFYGWYLNDLNVNNNVIVGYGRGMQFPSSVAGTFNVKGNFIANTAKRGLQVHCPGANENRGCSPYGAGPVTWNIQGNTFRSNSLGEKSAALRISGAAALTDDVKVNVSNNLFDDTAEKPTLGSGILWGGTSFGAQGRLTVSNNRFALSGFASNPQSAYAFEYGGPNNQTISLSSNSWGTAKSADAIRDLTYLTPTAATDITFTVSPWISGYTNGTPPDGFPAGVGFWPTSVVLSSDIPGKPTAVSATPGNGQVTVSWTAPEGAKSLTGYTVTASAAGQASSTCSTAATPPATPATVCTVEELTNGAPYTFTVTATNAAGTGEPSASSSATPRTVPEAPTAVIAIAGNGSASVSWTAPSIDGGSAITSYTVTGTPSGSCVVNSGTPLPTTCTVTGLTNGAAYTFTVTATNAAGTSPPSSASGPVTPTAPPGPGPGPVPVPSPTASPSPSPSPTPTPSPSPTPAPTPSPAPVPSELEPGEALVIVDGQQQSVEVIPNAQDNGLVVEGEGWQMDLDATGPNGQPLNLTPDGALLLETEGDVVTSGTGFEPDSEVALYMDPPVGTQTSGASWLRAIVRQVTGTILVGTVPVNAQGIFSGRVALPPDVEPGQRMLQAVGTSPTGQTRALNLGVVVEPAKVPGAPTNVTPVPGNRQAALTWTAPVRPGASPITGYRIEQSRNGGPWTVAIANTGSARPNASTNAVVARLVNGDDYRFRVTAINAAGLGRTSEPSASTTPEAPEGRSILIVGQRTTIDGKSGIRVRGETTGFTRKAILRPWTRFPGQKAFTEGRDRIRVTGKGTFTWQRQTKKSVTVYIQAGDGTRSNRVVIPAR